MSRFTWIHLSDFHAGCPGQSNLWPNVRERLLDDIAYIHNIVGQVHAVIFSGDLTYSGQKHEFEQLNAQLLDPLWERFARLGSKPQLFAVPGNHDLIRPDSKRVPPSARVLLAKGGMSEIEEEFWTEPNSPYRELIECAFQNYKTWWSISDDRKIDARQGLLPGDLAATIKVDDSSTPDGKRAIALIGLNTAFLQLNGENFLGRLTVDVRQLNSLCKEDPPSFFDAHSAAILVTHHGLDWLNDRSRNDAYTEINPAGRFIVHAFGHEHELRSTSLAHNGGKIIRSWQAASLFGMEKYGNPPAQIRRHGYSFGSFEFDNGSLRLRSWPRLAQKDSSGWRFLRDSSHSLNEDDGGTHPEQVDITTSGTSGNHFLEAEGKGKTKEPLIRSVAANWPRPASDSIYAAYCRAVCSAHGHIGFVEIPYLKDISDVELDRLYVEPRFSHQEIHSDAASAVWQRRMTPLDALREHNQIILLGDPGSGKSTFVSCLSWMLCRPQDMGHSWAQAFTGYIPLPIILRELQLRADITWESLIQSFLNHRIGKLLASAPTIAALMAQGRAVILLDGLDEIGNIAVRTKLRDAVHVGMTTYPHSKWILTSRVVGYEQVPFHYRNELSSQPLVDSNSSKKKDQGKEDRIPMGELLYLSPFDDDQILRFATNWYSQHESNQELIAACVENFINAIRQNDGTQRLARIPYLLTLMALIHHKNARLPHGRTELYERIATAYLESIDVRRQLDQLPYSLNQKRRWLADVAYRMQLRRTKQSNDGDILVSRAEVQRWLRATMEESGAGDSRKESEEVLNYFARRAGLLLPRGEGRFSFMHLSLQEYFAACFLEERLTASRFLKKEKIEPSDEQIYAWADSEPWRETFVLLFELLSEKSKGDTEALLHYLFDERFSRSDDTGSTAAGLLAELASDPFVSLSADVRSQMRKKCWLWALRRRSAGRARQSMRFRNRVVRTLLMESKGDLEMAWKLAGISLRDLRATKVLNLGGCTSVTNLRPIEYLKSLTSLSLDYCPGISDFSPLCKLTKLEFLNLEGWHDSAGLDVLSRLKSLRTLIVGSPFDLGLVTGLPNLRELHLHYQTSLDTDLTPLATMRKLDYVCVFPRDRPANIALEFRTHPERILSKGIARLVTELPTRNKGSRSPYKEIQLSGRRTR